MNQKILNILTIILTIILSGLQMLPNEPTNVVLQWIRVYIYWIAGISAATGQTHQNYSDKSCNIPNCKVLIINALGLLMLDNFRIFIV